MVGRGARSLGMPKRMLLLLVKGSGFGLVVVVVVVSGVTWFGLEAEWL